jgi:hypothetical protein
MPQESYRDHGVSGQHWLLDEELASLSKGPAARPAAREPVEVAPLPAVAVNGGAAVPPRGNFVVLVAGLVTALLVYALLSNAAVVGAFEDVFPRDGARALSTSAADAPRASELAELRGLLALRPPATIERGPTLGNAPATQKLKSGNKPPAPPPIIPEIPPEIPAVEVPRSPN